MSVVDQLLSCSGPELKRRFNMRGKKRGKYKRRVARKERSKEELVCYLRENDIKTRDSLESIRGEGDPSPYDYVKAFGSWTQASAYAWRDMTLKFDRLYIVKSVIEFNLWTSRKYSEARGKRPDVIPSLERVKKEFGCWRCLTGIAKMYSMKSTVSEYVDLKRSLGRVPTVNDCRRNNVELSSILSIFKKREFDRFVSLCEEDF